mgnify:CR=1 FL=1
MPEPTDRQRRLGWYAFDWASQPFHTLLLTFIFAPYLKELLDDGDRAQALWGYTVGAAGLVVALAAPVLGAVADAAGGRVRFVAVFSVLYMAGAAALWPAAPGAPSLALVLPALAVGILGVEFATIFTNALLPTLGPRAALGRISGTGWALGYAGGVLALALVLTFLAEDGESGRTLAGLSPAFGLDPAAREGTRAAGPVTALWYALFMIPFFLWVRDPRRAGAGVASAARGSLPAVARSLARLPGERGLTAFLAASMLYRDALAGIYIFGGIYAAGMLGWSAAQVGLFGILAAVSGALFAWIGGVADSRLGPKPVIVTCLIALLAAVAALPFLSRGAVFTVAVPAGSALPDIAFYVVGAVVGAAGGAVQAASRTMMVRQALPGRMTEGFGLYALAGKMTAFIAPLSVGLMTDLTGSQPLGILPILALLIVGLWLMRAVGAAGRG